MVLMSVGGCASRRPAAIDLNSASTLAIAQAALSPKRLIIHPLTRIGVDTAGRPALLLHVELRDQFEQNTRALGQVRVTIQRWGTRPTDAEMAAESEPGGTPPTTGPEGTLTWAVDLRDPERNALLYDDLITRTYVLTLTGIPTWLSEWSERGSEAAGGSGGVAGAAAGGGGAPVVAAEFEFPNPRDPGGPSQTVRDSARLSR
jgi:hypothetical protein